MPQNPTEKKKRLELRIMGASEDHVNYVKELAQEGRRTVPSQLEVIIDEHKIWSKQMKKA